MRFFRHPRTLFLLVVLALVGLHALGVLRPVETLLAGALRPVQRTVSGWFAHPSGAEPADLQDAQDRMIRLLVENARLKEERSHLLSIIDQQEVLRSRQLTGVAATVIGKSPEGDAHVVVLDRGVGDGVAVGQPVIAADGVLIGTVQEAGPGRSLVLLLTDTGARVAAEVQNDQRSPGIVAGKLGLSMTMEFIPQQEAVEEGQLVVTAAESEFIPAGLPIGTVTSVDVSEGELFQTASVTPLLDTERLRYVTILTSS